jgi:hypothetical protein
MERNLFAKNIRQDGKDSHAFIQYVHNIVPLFQESYSIPMRHFADISLIKKTWERVSLVSPACHPKSQQQGSSGWLVASTGCCWLPQHSSTGSKLPMQAPLSFSPYHTNALWEQERQ